MEIYDYCTSGGKNLILEYIERLPKAEQLELFDIREERGEFHVSKKQSPI